MNTTMEVRTQKQTLKSLGSRLLWVSPLAMLAASAANLGLYAAAGRLFPEVTAWSGAGIGPVIGASFVYLFIGTLIFAAVARFSSRPARNYLIVSVIGLVLSMVMPITAGLGFGPPGTPPASLATVITLCLMHVLAFAISVPMFIRLVLDNRS
jgi:hypothetical protein